MFFCENILFQCFNQQSMQKRHKRPRDKEQKKLFYNTLGGLYNGFVYTLQLLLFLFFAERFGFAMDNFITTFRLYFWQFMCIIWFWRFRGFLK